MAEYNDCGQEIPDPTPVAVPAGWARPPSLEEIIRRHIRTEMSRQAADAGQETFEEADDFEVDEDPDPLSAYEMPEGREEWPGGVKPVDPAPPLDPHEKSNLGDSGGSQGHSGESASSTDSSTVKPPAGGSSRS